MLLEMICNNSFGFKKKIFTEQVWKIFIHFKCSFCQFSFKKTGKQQGTKELYSPHLTAKIGKLP